MKRAKSKVRVMPKKETPIMSDPEKFESEVYSFRMSFPVLTRTILEVMEVVAEHEKALRIILEKLKDKQNENKPK